METNIAPVATTYGYARVSAVEQNERRQIDALMAAGVAAPRIFVDHKSGKGFHRPAWRRLTRKLKRGDLLVITSIDRMGRNYNDIIGEWRTIVKKKGVFIRVLDMPLIDTTTSQGLLSMFISDLVLQILSFVAEAEREQIRRRQREGIVAAKSRGCVLDARPSRCRQTSKPWPKATSQASCHLRMQLTDARCPGRHSGHSGKRPRA